MLRLKRPLRPSSNVDPKDTLAAKLHLADLGYYAPPTGEFHGWPDADLFAAMRRFQSDAGETPDGEMLPGGPTEAALNRLSAARPPVPLEKPNDYQRALAMGLVREEDAVSDSETWTGSLERRTGQKLTPTALPALLAIPPAAAALADAGAVVLPGLLGGLGLLAGQNALQEAKRVPEGASLMEAEGWHRAALPPEKQEPMRGPSADEADRLNKELSKPLKGPLPEPVEVTPEAFPAELSTTPQILIFPDQSDEIDQITILEDRKGNAKTKAQIDSIRDWFLDRGWTHEAGGRDRDKKNQEKRELWIPPWPKEWGGDRRRGGRFVDLTMKSPDGKIVHIQTVTLDKNGKPTAEELDAAEAIRRATGDHVILVPKTWLLRKGRSSRGK